MALKTTKEMEETIARRKGNAKKPRTVLEAFGEESQTSGADWSACDAELLKEVVVLITDLGGAVIVGMSKDMSSHSLTLMLDKVRKSVWLAGDADLNEGLQDVIGKLSSET